MDTSPLSYRQAKMFSVKGKVSKVEWTNPHVRFYVDVADASGKVMTWNMELASPSALARNGWTSRTIKIGDEVSVEGYAAKVAPDRGNARSGGNGKRTVAVRRCCR